jgi:chorismate mutase
MHYKKFFQFIIAGWLLGWCTMAISQPLTQSNHLFSLINQRLTLMQHVAHYKYAHHQPIFVPGVEQKILQIVGNDAKAAGLDVAKMQSAIQLQMQIGVKVQQAWTDEWHKGIKPVDPLVDLDTQLRPALAKITNEIVSQTAKAKAELADQSNQTSLIKQINLLVQVRFVTESDKQSLLQSLLDVVKK